MLAPGSSGPDILFEVMARPWADYIGHGPRARAWIRIAAETAARPERMWDEFLQHSPAVFVDVGTSLLQHLGDRLGAGSPSIA